MLRLVPTRAENGWTFTLEGEQKTLARRTDPNGTNRLWIGPTFTVSDAAIEEAAEWAAEMVFQLGPSWEGRINLFDHTGTISRPPKMEAVARRILPAPQPFAHLLPEGRELCVVRCGPADFSAELPGFTPEFHAGGPNARAAVMALASKQRRRAALLVERAETIEAALREAHVVPIKAG